MFKAQYPGIYNSKQLTTRTFVTEGRAITWLQQIGHFIDGTINGKRAVDVEQEETA